MISNFQEVFLTLILNVSELVETLLPNVLDHIQEINLLVVLFTDTFHSRHVLFIIVPLLPFSHFMFLLFYQLPYFSVVIFSILFQVWELSFNEIHFGVNEIELVSKMNWVELLCRMHLRLFSYRHPVFEVQAVDFVTDFL